MTDRVLSTVSLLTSDMAGRWPRVIAERTALLQGHDSTIGGNRGSGHADPTASLAAAVVDSTAHMNDLRATLLFVARELDAELLRTPKDMLDPKAASRARCSGEYDPTCTDNAVAKGLCYKCYRRKARGQAPATQLVDPKQPSTRYKPLSKEEAARALLQGQHLANLDALQLGDNVLPDYIAGQTLANEQEAS